jgi:DeoR/GlpR family transcriptional regulator of sugar metabolism
LQIIARKRIFAARIKTKYATIPYDQTMLKEERFQYILDKIKSDQRVLLPELSQALNVSEDTIRRDIGELSRNGLLSKVRGGAISIPHSPIPYAYRDREQHDQSHKLEIARKAVGLLREGQVLILDGGTTTFSVASRLPKDLRLTVVTNSFPIATLLSDHPLVETLFVGGRVYKSSRVTVGVEAVDRLRRIRADVCMIGTYGLHPEIGLTVSDVDEAEVKLAMIKASNQAVALVTAEKLGTAEAFLVCELGALHTIITNNQVDPKILELYRDKGVIVL